jgi:SAM-dependent methyltransferase
MKIEVVTDFPVALDSPDHTHPWGTTHDNHCNLNFNERLRQLMPDWAVSVLDLGCAGGRFVKTLLDENHFAVGIEGSDFSKRMNRSEWCEIPDNLHTADIAKPFQVQVNGTPVLFGVVTLWDVIEHLKRVDLPMLFSNINAHLIPGGIVILSVSPNEEAPHGVPLHQTVEGKAWWLNTFRSLGWQSHPGLVGHFGEQMVRTQRDAPGSFYFVLSRDNEEPVTR